MHVRKSLGCLEETIGRNMAVKVASGETNAENSVSVHQCPIESWRQSFG